MCFNLYNVINYFPIYFNSTRVEGSTHKKKRKSPHQLVKLCLGYWWGLSSPMLPVWADCQCRGLQKLMCLEGHHCQVGCLSGHLSVPPP